MSERTWEDNADEFAALSKQGVDVRLAVYVACSVSKRRRGNQPKSANTDLKTSAEEFARRTGATGDRILRHLKAWDACAEDRQCKPSADLTVDDAMNKRMKVPTQEQFREKFDASTSGGRPRASMKEIADRVAVDKDYAATLLTEIELAQPKMIDGLVNRKEHERITESLKLVKIEPEAGVEPFEAELDSEAIRIRARLQGTALDIRNLRKRAEKDQWPRLVPRIEQGITEVLQSLTGAEVTEEVAP